MNLTGNSMAIDLKTIDERLAKAKEDAAFWEKARAILSDPRMSQGEQNQQPTQTERRPSTAPRAYGEQVARVLEVLPSADTRASLTTKQIVEQLQGSGYVFQSSDPQVAVNGALIALEGQGLAQSVGKVGNAKLWRKKKAKSQEAPEGAS